MPTGRGGRGELHGPWVGLGQGESSRGLGGAREGLRRLPGRKTQHPPPHPGLTVKLLPEEREEDGEVDGALPLLQHGIQLLFRNAHLPWRQRGMGWTRAASLPARPGRPLLPCHRTWRSVKQWGAVASAGEVCVSERTDGEGGGSREGGRWALARGPVLSQWVSHQPPEPELLPWCEQPPPPLPAGEGESTHRAGSRSPEGLTCR